MRHRKEFYMRILEEVVVFREGKRIKVDQLTDLIGEEEIDILYREQEKWKIMQGKFVKPNVFWRRTIYNSPILYRQADKYLVSFQPEPKMPEYYNLYEFKFAYYKGERIYNFPELVKIFWNEEKITSILVNGNLTGSTDEINKNLPKISVDMNITAKSTNGFGLYDQFNRLWKIE